MSSFRRRYKAFLAGWGRDLLLAGGGALTGLAVAFAFGVGPRHEPPASPEAPTHAASGPIAATSPAAAATPPDSRYAPTPFLPDERLNEAPLAPPATPVPPAWQRFAALTEKPDGRPMIAVIIDDMGVDHGRSARAIRLPAPVTLAFLPYARGLARQLEAARRLGHELMVHLPMEPERHTADPGPDVLRVADPPEELRRRIELALGRFTGVVGLNNHMGSRFTEDPAGMRVLLGEVNAHGMLFIDSRTTAKTVAPEIARELGVPFAARDVFLDDDPTAPSVLAQLRRAEAVARHKGSAIAIGHPRDATLDELKGWLSALERRGFVLVPVSAVVRQRWHAG